jgi:hypothetical protein
MKMWMELETDSLVVILLASVSVKMYAKQMLVHTFRLCCVLGQSPVLAIDYAVIN